MDLRKIEGILADIFGENNIKSYSKGFRVIVDYENMPFCIILRLDNGRLVMDKDAVDEDQAHYDEAYKKAYKILLQNKEKFDGEIDI